MVIVGHRGAAGAFPENTIPSIEHAVELGVDMIEFDVQATKDNQLIVFHDSNLKRICGLDKKVEDMSLKEINLTATHSGHPIPSFYEAMVATAGVPVLIDCKGKAWSKLLLKELKHYKNHQVAVTSRNRDELLQIAKDRPGIETYISELTKPLDAIHSAKLLNLSGISLNFWVLNPLSYFYARLTKRKIMVFTINQTLMARFLHLLYPRVAIITNHPGKLVKHRKRR